MYLHEVVNLKHFYQLQFSWSLISDTKRAALPSYEVILISVQKSPEIWLSELRNIYNFAEVAHVQNIVYHLEGKAASTSIFRTQ